MSDQVLQAYVRPQLAARVVQALMDAGCGDIILAECRRVVSNMQASDLEYSVQIGQKVESMMRVEAIGPAGAVGQWVRIIQESGTTHRHGDGMVTVMAVARHVHLSGAPGIHDPDPSEQPKAP